jgi:hypothetical protein
LEWLGFRAKPDSGKSSWLRKLTGISLTLIVTSLTLAVVAGGLATLAHFIAAVAVQSDADHEAIRNLGLIVAAVLGAPFVVWRAAVAQKLANTAEQSHITDQINKAVSGLGAVRVISKIGRPVKIFMGQSEEVTQLVKTPDSFELKARSVEIRRYFDTSYVGGNNDDVFAGTHIEVRTWKKERTEIEWQGIPPNLTEGEAIGKEGDWSVFAETVPNIEVRVGSIYALERISQDSSRDHIQIMEVLTAYIRENGPVGNLEPSEEPFTPIRPRSDIQAALDVIRRRPPERCALEKTRRYRLDLSKVNLSGADFSRGNFKGARLSGSKLEAANFRSANLSAARLNSCLLNFANFFEANLLGAILERARIDRGEGSNGSITLASDMRGVSLINADISCISYLPPKKTHSPTLGSSDTKLHSHIETKRTNREEDIKEFNDLSNGVEIEDEIGVRDRLVADGFLYWSPFDSSDGATKAMLLKLWAELGLEGFPFFDQ